MVKKEGWQRGEGPYSSSKDIKFTRDNAPGFRDISAAVDADKGTGRKLRGAPDLPYKPVDISNRVDPSWKRTDGFSARLDKGKKEDA